MNVVFISFLFRADLHIAFLDCGILSAMTVSIYTFLFYTISCYYSQVQSDPKCL